MEKKGLHFTKIVYIIYKIIFHIVMTNPSYHPGRFYEIKIAGLDE